MLNSRRFLAAQCFLGVVWIAAAVQPVIAAAQEPLSQPEYGVIFEENVAIPVRDGTVLRADVYRPDVRNTSDEHIRFPVLISLIP